MKEEFPTNLPYSWFVRKDLDGFFGLMVDNLIQLILIVSLCRELIHLPDSYIFGRILPGAAISILVGNFYYSWQARRLAMESGKEDVTALPYGINTVSLFAYVFFIMMPVYQETKDPIWAWKVGLVACSQRGDRDRWGLYRREGAPADTSCRSSICLGGDSCDLYRHGFYLQDLCKASHRACPPGTDPALLFF